MNRSKINKKALIGAVVIVAIATALPYMAHAALTADSTLTQAVNAGTLSTDIRDAGGSIVGSPSFAMSAATVSNSQETVTGTFGTNTQRVTVDNPGGASNGWTLTWNATTPGTEVWTNGSDDYPYGFLRV